MPKLNKDDYLECVRIPHWEWLQGCRKVEEEFIMSHSRCAKYPFRYMEVGDYWVINTLPHSWDKDDAAFSALSKVVKECDDGRKFEYQYSYSSSTGDMLTFKRIA